MSFEHKRLFENWNNPRVKAFRTLNPDESLWEIDKALPYLLGEQSIPEVGKGTFYEYSDEFWLKKDHETDFNGKIAEALALAEAYTENPEPEEEIKKEIPAPEEPSEPLIEYTEYMDSAPIEPQPLKPVQRPTTKSRRLLPLAIYSRPPEASMRPSTLPGIQSGKCPRGSFREEPVSNFPQETLANDKLEQGPIFQTLIAHLRRAIEENLLRSFPPLAGDPFLSFPGDPFSRHKNNA
jgi:hypothetical protein